MHVRVLRRAAVSAHAEDITGCAAACGSTFDAHCKWAIGHEALSSSIPCKSPYIFLRLRQYLLYPIQYGRTYGQACTGRGVLPTEEDILYEGCHDIQCQGRRTHCCLSCRGCVCPDLQSRQSFRCLNAQNSISPFLLQLYISSMRPNAHAPYSAFFIRSDHICCIHGSGKAHMK